jgi:hypothetical protein
MIYGVDVASFQSSAFPLETPGDKHPVDFVLIKATQGTGYVNPRMAAQADWARTHSLVTGFYHFLLAGNVQAQAEYFVSRADSVAGDVLACDWETDPDTGRHPSNAEKDAFIRAVQALRPDHRVLLYCNTSFWKTLDSTSFAGDGLWIATGGYAAGHPPIESEWLLHQYSTAGSLDHNVAQFSSRAEMAAWASGGTEDVALTPDDKAWFVAQLRAVVPDAVLTKDGILESPADASDHDTNPFWALETYVKDTGAKVRAAAKVLDTLLAQARANGTSLSALQDRLAGLDLDALITQLQALKLVVTVEEPTA